MQCPFCGRDPFHYVDIGVGREAVAVDCCELGDLYFRGMRPPIKHDVTLDADEFRRIGDKLTALLAENNAYHDKFGELVES